MIANYHTHTFRCHHAKGEDEEIVKNAIAAGLKTLGFADHAPYIYPDGYVSYYKMTPEESYDYFASLRGLAEKYRDQITIHIGYEAEYYPSLWEDTLEFWKTTNTPEYLLLGQHFIREEYPTENQVQSFVGSIGEAELQTYVKTVVEGIETGKFTYLAHPDVINYTGGDLDFYREQMTKIVVAAKKINLPLELNLLGIRGKRNYPTPAFWEMAAKYNPDVILGSDAHSPFRVADKDEIVEALRMADKYGLHVIEEIEFVNPFA